MKNNIRIQRPFFGVKKSNFVDISGFKFERLKVIRPIGYTCDKIIWECICDCGNITLVRADGLKKGSTKSCGCLQKEAVIESGKNNATLNSPQKSLFTRYRLGAKRRNYVWDLSFEEALKLFSSNCWYCGKIPEQICKNSRGSFILYNGIDRKDPTLGYLIDNVLPCCKHCNYAKMAMSYEEFLRHVKLITTNLTL